MCIVHTLDSRLRNRHRFENGKQGTHQPQGQGFSNDPTSIPHFLTIPAIRSRKEEEEKILNEKKGEDCFAFLSNSNGSKHDLNKRKKRSQVIILRLKLDVKNCVSWVLATKVSGTVISKVLKLDRGEGIARYGMDSIQRWRTTAFSSVSGCQDDDVNVPTEFSENNGVAAAATAAGLGFQGVHAHSPVPTYARTQWRR